MKLMILAVLATLMIPSLALADGPSLPSDLEGWITADYPSGQSITATNTRTGYTQGTTSIAIPDKGANIGYFMFNLAELGARWGDTIQISAGDKTTSIVFYGQDVIEINLGSISSVVPPTPEPAPPTCPTCPGCDPCGPIEPTDEETVAWLMLMTAGASSAVIWSITRKREGQKCLTNNLAIKRYRSSTDKTKLMEMHKHKGISSYHSPLTSHTNPDYRHNKNDIYCDSLPVKE